MLHPKYICEKLQKRGLSQGIIATLTGASQATVSRIMAGANQPSFALAKEMNRVYWEITNTTESEPQSAKAPIDGANK